MVEHQSRLALDQLLVGVASDDVKTHVADCTICQARVAELRAVDQRFLAGAPRPAVPRRRWPVLEVLAASIAVAALALIAMSPPRELSRAKGASTVTLVRRDSMQPLGDEAVAPRETLLIRYSADKPYLLIVGLEGTGRVQTLIDERITPGNGAMLGTGIELDAYSGPELWIAILSNERIPAASMLAELAARHRASRGGASLAAVMATPLPADGEQTFWIINKVAR